MKMMMNKSKLLRRNNPDAPPPLKYFLCMLCEGSTRLPSMESVRAHLRRVHELDPDRLVDMGRMDDETHMWSHADVPAHFIIKGMTTPGMCDFCNQRFKMGARLWRYEANSFVITLPFFGEYRSHRDWASCDGCSTLIERQDWHRLAMRIIRQMGHAVQSPIGVVIYPGLRRLHEAFREHRTGAVRRLYDQR
jgi:hypothetical protein